MTRFRFPDQILWLDLETFSHADLKKVGAHNYARHPTTALSLFSGAFDDGIPFLLEEQQFAKAERLIERLSDPDWTKVAWNVPFDRAIITEALGIESPPEQWLDAMSLALTCGLPASLDRCCEAVGLKEDERKHRDGRRLIHLFSKPAGKDKRRNDKQSHPDEWVKWCAYGMQDVMSMRTIIEKIKPYISETFTAEEYSIYLTDGEINRTGVPIDLEHCRNAIDLYQDYTKLRIKEAQAITGLENPKSPPQLKGWLKEKGVDVPDMRAGTLTNLLSERKLLAPIRDAITIRLELSRSSVAKFEQMLTKTDPYSGRLYDTLQYYGAHTGRWAGRGVQLQNLPQGIIYGDTPEEVLPQHEAIRRLVSASDHQTLRVLYNDVGKALSSTVRSTLAAPDGKTYVVSDYASIETAVIAWLAGCERLLQLFREGLDPYRDFASVLTGQKYSLITKAERTYAKPAVLGAVFGLGPDGYMAYAENFGQAVDRSEAQRIIDTFRSTYPEIQQFWNRLKHACHTVVKGHPGLEMPAGDHVAFYKLDNRMLFARLPSGRSLAYPVPQITVEETEWGNREQFSYMTEKDRQWVRTFSHPGKLAENMTQAVARDLLANGILNAKSAGLEVVLHVHDEIVALVPVSRAEVQRDLLIQAMESKPSWAKGLPVGTDSFITERYVKL